MSETREYIRRSIEACEASPEETISDEAMSTIFNATAGVPRLINQITTEAIDCAAESEQTLIDEGTVDRAWANLQQLPSPMVEQPSLETEGSVVEFGELTDPLPQMRDVNPVEEFQSGLAAESSDVEERVSDEDLPLTMADAIESSSAGDILFDEASACQSVECEAMVQEAAHDEQKPAVTEPPTDPVKLFGEFDNEEKIVVGATSKKPHRSEPAELELESMLHSQIIGLSQFASENTAARYVETDYLASPQEAESNAANEEPVPEAVENMDGAQGTSEESPSVIWYDEPSGSSEGEQGDATGSEGNDDSDLLWITEDIDVERRSEHGASRMTPIRLDQADSSDAPKLKVDYREMLEKMRNHA